MIRTVGIPWYDRDSYDDIRRAMADADKLPDSYAYWLSSAESVETAVASSGIRVMRIPLDLAAFLEWCAAKGASPNASARSGWAAEMAKKASSSGDLGDAAPPDMNSV